MSKSSNNLNEYGKILADNLSSLRRNGSPQELKDLVVFLEKRLESQQQGAKNYQDNLLGALENYQPADSEILGTREALSAEVDRSRGSNDELSKLLTNLKTLSSDISANKDIGQSLDKFRTSIGASPEVRPNFFARVQTFFADLFTDNKTQQKNTAQENLMSTMSSLLVKTDQARAPMQEKLAKFMEQAQGQAKGVSQSTIEPNMSPSIENPPDRDLPPPPVPEQGVQSNEANLSSKDLPPPPNIGNPPERDLPPPPVPERDVQSNEVDFNSEDLPPPPVPERDDLDMDLPPPPLPSRDPLPQEFGGPPTDLPPPLPPEFGGPPTDLPPPLPPEFDGPSAQNIDTEKSLSDTLKRHSVDNIAPENDWDLGADQAATKKQSGKIEANADIRNTLLSTLAKRRGSIEDDVDDLGVEDNEFDSEFQETSPPAKPTIDVEVKKQTGVVPPPPPPLNAGSKPPPPPGPMTTKSRENPPVLKSEPKQSTKPDLLEQIKGGVQLKKTEDRETSLDQGEFKYAEIKKQEGLRAQLGGEYDTPALVNNKTKEQQMNALYSAVVGGLTKVVKELADITVEIDTGKTEYDDFEEKDIPIMETKKVFSKEDLEKVYEAANNLADNKEKLSYAQKENLKKGIEEVGKNAGIQSDKGVGR